MIVAERDDVAVATRRPASATWRRALTPARFLVAVALAGAASAAVWRALPGPLSVRTDIVGSPIHSNYNIELLMQRYYVAVVLFPLAALLLYLALGALCGWLGLQPCPAERARGLVPTDADEVTGPGVRAGWSTAARLLAVGAGFGLEVAIVGDHREQWFVLAVAAAAVVYAGLLLGAAVVVERATGGFPRGDMLAILNALTAPVIIAGLLGISAVTTVTVTADRTVHHYGWLPAWLALAATVGLILAIGARIVRARARALPLAEIERRVVLLVTGPVCLFLLVTTVPGAMGPVDMFHEGESLVGARLTLDGYFPWRDLMTIHGILQDQLSPLPGFAVFGETRWAATAGRTLLVTPLGQVLLYVFAAVMLERAWPLVCASLLVMVGGTLSVLFPGTHIGGPLAPVADARFMLWPLQLVLMKVVLERPAARWSALLGLALVVQTVLAPESAYCLAAVGLVFLLRDVHAGGWRQPLAEGFARTIWFGAGAAAFGVATIGFLVVNGALGDFVMYFLAFARGHELTGSIPVTLGAWLADPAFAFLAFSTPVAVLLSMWYFAAAVLGGRPLGALDWVLAAASLLALVYYTKFLARADLHVFESYVVTVPVIIILLHRGIQAAERMVALARPGAWAARWLTARPVSVLVLLVALAGTGPNLAQRIQQVPAQVRSQVAEEPSLNRLGYGGELDLATYDDVDQVLRAYLRPGDWVFDFTNAPAFYYYLLARNPHTRYFNVSMAIPEVAQKDLVDQLRRDRPRLVVFTNDRFGFPSWDNIPNQVRHYDVSQYILDNYRPLLSIRGQVLYADATAGLSPDRARALPLAEAPLTQDLPFRGAVCDWGMAPNFLAASPPPRDRAVPTVTIQPRTSGEEIVTALGWAVDHAAGEPAREVVAVSGGRVVGRAPTGESRPDVAAVFGQPAGAMSGFELEVPAQNAGAGIGLYAISRTGVASELARGAGVAPGGDRLTTVDLGGGDVVPVRAGAATGQLDVLRSIRRLQITLPPGATWSDYRWLDVDAAGAGLRSGTWTISDVLAPDPGHRISFRTLDGARSIRVYVGSCGQWHGYTSPTLSVSHEHVLQSLSFRLGS